MQSALSDEEPGSECKNSPQDNVESPIASEKRPRAVQHLARLVLAMDFGHCRRICKSLRTHAHSH
jgi:hypothetical protein